MKIRIASMQDAPALLEIYKYYVENTAISFEYDVPSRQWFIRDGQWDRTAPNGWKSSLNGTYVNAKEISSNGYFVQVGDIISIGDTKLRVEAY